MLPPPFAKLNVNLSHVAMQHISSQQPHLKIDSLLARPMSLHHGLTDLRDNHLTCFTDMLYSSMVLGNLPSQLEILSTGQNYYGTRYNT